MKKIVFVVERTGTGFSAYSEDFENIPVGTTGETIEELRANIVEAYNSFAELSGKKELSINDFSIQIDVPQFFEYYKIINASALSSRIGMDKTLLSQYVNGHKKPSHKQIEKIMTGIKQLGNELASLELSF
ncbi:type II toxin-antitoxin system HicB family antitoxin [Pedobacter sp. PWIIR3]